MFNAREFIKKQIDEIKQLVGNESVLIAVSGGIDSTVCAVLAHKAIGNQMQCVFIDTGFIRSGESEKVEFLFKSLGLPIKIIHAADYFIDKIKSIEDAEKKRKKFRKIFYEVLSKIAKSFGYKFLIQGTIAPDWIETSGRIKTQHNVLEQIGINPIEKFGFKIIEPLRYLYKDQVRLVAHELGLKPEISEKQPFPGPGLLVRVIGKISREKIEILKNVTEVIEDKLFGDQYFAAIIDDNCVDNSKIRKMVSSFLNIEESKVNVRVPKNLVTGVKGDLRAYKKLVALSIKGENFKQTIKNLVLLQNEIISRNPSFTRIVYSITEKPREKKYLIFLRSVETRDFMTAKVTEIEWNILRKVSNEIMKKNKEVSEVFYDITPKPPATIEYE
jgi:GMP synthase (glutamine-hydrolysing)